MKNFNIFSNQAKTEKEEFDFEKYQKLYNESLNKLVEKNPELDYLLYDDCVLLAQGSDFPIIDENGNIGRSIFSTTLKTDKNLENQKNKLVEKIKRMFDDFSEIHPDVKINSFPKEHDYSEMKKTLKMERKKPDIELVKLQTIYANTMWLLKNGKLKEEEAKKIIKYYIEKYQKTKYRDPFN